MPGKAAAGRRAARCLQRTPGRFRAALRPVLPRSSRRLKGTAPGTRARPGGPAPPGLHTPAAAAARRAAGPRARDSPANSQEPAADVSGCVR